MVEIRETVTPNTLGVKVNDVVILNSRVCKFKGIATAKVKVTYIHNSNLIDVLDDTGAEHTISIENVKEIVKTVTDIPEVKVKEKPLNNKDRIGSHLASKGYIIGCYDKRLETLSKHQLKRVIKLLEDYEDSQDIDLYIDRKLHVLEVCYVDAEVDLTLKTKAEYVAEFGEERWSR